MKQNLLNLLTSLLIVWLLSVPGYSQIIPKLLKADNKEIRKIAKQVDSDRWVYFKENLRERPREILNKHKDAFGLSELDSMALVKIKPMEKGYVRHMFNQYFNGVKVDGAEYSIYPLPVDTNVNFNNTYSI